MEVLLLALAKVLVLGLALLGLLEEALLGLPWGQGSVQVLVLGLALGLL